MERGDYYPSGQPLAPEDKIALELAFHSEFARRDMDPTHPQGRVEPPPAEELS